MDKLLTLTEVLREYKEGKIQPYEGVIECKLSEKSEHPFWISYNQLESLIKVGEELQKEQDKLMWDILNKKEDGQ